MELARTLQLVAGLLFLLAAVMAFTRANRPGGERKKQAALVFLIVGAFNLAMYFGLFDALFAE